MTGLTGMTATEIVSRVHQREISVSDIAGDYLARIEQYDHLIEAYQTVDPDMVRAQAAWLDSQTEHGARLPLHGVPVGVKDIIDVAGLPTIAGFEPYRKNIAVQDASIVAALRSAGALVLGKTHTTQFAVGDPAPTRNPWNLDKSPAGSSAGSGAAVPAGMAALALGSQTAGSMLRPAAFNGSVGFKPTFGWISLDGVIPLCWSLDHMGLYTATVDDMSLVYDALTGAGSEESLPAPDKPRIALLTEYIEMSSPEVATHIRDVARALEATGATVVETTMPDTFEHLFAIHQTIMPAEMAAAHSANLTRYPEDYGPRIRAGVEVGTLVPAAYLEQARRHRRALAEEVARFMTGYDALLLPTTSTEACDRAETGDRRFQVPATLLGLPAISLPTALSSNRLPLGTQLIGHRGRDRELLGVASWATGVVRLIGRPDMEQLISRETGGR
jgi:aspartyl-tRNA(Asn)/glutamyl-tRNA(Gln) amidotransferase subunit A